MHPPFFWKHPKECAAPGGRKDVRRTFGAQGSSVLKTGGFPALAWQKISSLNRSAALSLSKVELPTPLNNCLMIPVLTSFSFRDNSLRSRRCCGECRRAGRPRPAVYRCGGFRADTIRPYQIPGKPCRGGYHPPAVSRRSLGVAELYAGTFNRTLVQS